MSTIPTELRLCAFDDYPAVKRNYLRAVDVVMPESSDELTTVRGQIEQMGLIVKNTMRVTSSSFQPRSLALEVKAQGEMEMDEGTLQAVGRLFSETSFKHTLGTELTPGSKVLRLYPLLNYTQQE